MSNRREFILKTAAASGALAVVRAPLSYADAVPSKPLRVLVLGGTGFIGPHLLHAALKRGHKASVFVYRPDAQKDIAALPAGVEPLLGDRNGDLQSIQNRDWDAVIDVATYGPIWIRTLGQALKDRVRHYTFISSVAVYDNSAVSGNGTDEQSKLLEYKAAADPYAVPQPGFQYGPLKVLCEREAEKQFPKKALIVRPTVISGPGDGVGGLTYLCVRMDAGGEMLAAGDPRLQMQLIDVRDMTDWMIRMIESGAIGPFNAVGPALPMGWAEMLGAIRSLSTMPVTLTWVPIPWLTERKVPAWSNALFFPTEVGIPGLLRMSNDKARRSGLTFRPLSVTARDTLDWYKSLPPARQAKVLLGKSLEDSMAAERELLAEWHARRRS